MGLANRRQRFAIYTVGVQLDQELLVAQNGVGTICVTLVEHSQYRRAPNRIVRVGVGIGFDGNQNGLRMLVRVDGLEWDR